MTNFRKSLLAISLMLGATQTYAAGFQLNSQSATGIGRAFAGDAVIADNASVLSRNPSAMALFDRAALSTGLTYVNIEVDVKDVNFADGQVDLGGIDDAGSTKLIPNIYYVQPLNDKWAFGVAAFSNFGTGTDTSSLLKGATFAPYDLIGNTEVTTVTLNTSLSYRINEMFSIGAGVDAVYGKGNLTRYAGNIPLVDVDADGVGFGGILGATFELNKDNRFGLSYRFSPTVTVTGDINVMTSQQLPGLGTQQIAIDYNELDVPLADIAQFAGFHQLTNRFAVHYTAQYTLWGDFDQITTKQGTATIATGSYAGTEVATNVKAPLKEYHWKNSWLFSVGGTYTVNDTLTLRAGYMFDNGVVDQLGSLSIPDSDRHWYTLGASYRLSDSMTVDLGAALVRGVEESLTETSALAGDVNAHTKSTATYYSMQFNYRF
ncbi:OmpP1/FadL family transporter [Shewanella fodinae]|jgi:long-chain fatty acid transport protein|uniref:Long-chain fatty acid transport protein n=1 Tax=Shewanella fodinae TaxID=552357 RepID=A0A4R2F663_9GAMM|nr:outer membrane protein transport protein [Shewanella fodinae]MCL2907051.1 OmpP1/FadL family transporter [Shewanella fodinae]TCN81037.1 long-chain fatty acid transport protein [Shewanella fodinae]GGZ04744.1 aromatic hydrocarbon degradation protein [Shewanella fodinae]